MEELKNLKEVKKSDNSKEEKLKYAFNRINDQSISDYIVCYLRFIISAYLKRNFEEYQYFISDGSSVPEFCLKEVEPMGIECDHLQIIALMKSVEHVLNGGILIEYLDNSDLDKTNHVLFPENQPPFLFLLYRPGHYDVLYK